MHKYIINLERKTKGEWKLGQGIEWLALPRVAGTLVRGRKDYEAIQKKTELNVEDQQPRGTTLLWQITLSERTKETIPTRNVWGRRRTTGLTKDRRLWDLLWK